jgi:SAM-dependent methyltransferase
MDKGMYWTNSLRCPRCNKGSLVIQTPGSQAELLPERGVAVCDECHVRFPIADSILDLVPKNTRPDLTLAGWSNHLPLVAQIYEHVWRPRSLSLLTHEQFPLARELALIAEWAELRPRQIVVDLGTSTGMYARGLARATRDWRNEAPAIIAIDLARGMLRVAQGYAQRDRVHNVASVRAPVEHLPFKNESVDVLVCGGSLNEFRSMPAALQEAHRVAVPGGRLVTMSLLATETRSGRWAQSNARASGIQFPTLDSFDRMVRAAGWRCERQQRHGVVLFAQMVKPTKPPRPPSPFGMGAGGLGRLDHCRRRRD